MRPRFAGGIYVVEAKKDGVTEYWTAATLQENAVAAVENELGSGWTVALTDRRLANQRLSVLNMRVPLIKMSYLRLNPRPTIFSAFFT